MNSGDPLSLASGGMFGTYIAIRELRRADYRGMARKRLSSPELDTSVETARILFLTYGHDAVQMATLRCAELKEAGDKAGLATWRKVLKNARQLAGANLQRRGTIN